MFVKERMLNDKYIVSELQLKMIELYPDDIEEIMGIIRSNQYYGNNEKHTNDIGIVKKENLIYTPVRHVDGD